ncbi:hypothetical protein BN6_16890 [Saccharothrix espanaensis DSM 44229]|uniref:Uncharacterized protein n=1 Tax=Saccharothrix espanaensis (strain ATCC 51144 / DSM 44229 / JCM 9112 / NBRC 15066 / NRRL 15764) TaxID=1179773 RepID=K0JT08_SACES|nr:hypothetical protein BN6_16890 [Saccharothrix espanaensis DSM 44229]
MCTPPPCHDQPMNVVRTTRVLGAGPFGEVGRPPVAAASATTIAVAGDLGPAQWNAWDVRVHHSQIGVYRADDHTCLHLVQSHWPVHCLAFHPTLPLVAAGTGSYNGGYMHEGKLLLVTTESGLVVSALPDDSRYRATSSATGPRSVHGRSRSPAPPPTTFRPPPRHSPRSPSGHHVARSGRCTR